MVRARGVLFVGFIPLVKICMPYPKSWKQEKSSNKDLLNRVL